MDMPFPGERVWLVNWVLEEGIGGYPNSSYKNTPYRLDNKLHSALAEAQLKIVQPMRLVLIRGSLR